MFDVIIKHKNIIIIITSIIYSIISLYILFKGIPKYFEKYSLATNILLLLGLFIISMYTIFKGNVDKQEWNIVLILISIIGVTTLILYWIFNNNTFSETTTILFNLTIFLTVGYLFYKYIKPYVINISSYSVLPIYVIGFIGIIVWIYKNIMNVDIFSKFNKNIGNEILKDIVPLNNIKNIENYNDLNKNMISTLNNNINEYYNYHYSISFWTFINSTQSSIHKYIKIFDYGRKPIVEYNSSTQTIRVRINSKTIYEGKMVTQKWSNIVITYDKGTVDVFINKKLVASVNGIVPHMDYDIMSVGENGGISGGIGHVTYYDKNIRKSLIEYNYKKYKNILNHNLFI